MGGIMRELIGFEITKLLRKPLVWASLAGMLLMMVLMAYNWVMPYGYMYREEMDGELRFTQGTDVIVKNKEIAAQFEGPLTTQKAQEIIETYMFSREAMESQSMDPDRQRNYSHNSMYDVLARDGFAKMDGSYSGATVEEIYGSDLAPDLVLGYFDGWEGTIYALIYDFLSWGCVVIIILTPLFAEEYTKRTDALILTGKRGRTLCPVAKVIAAYVVSLAGSLILLGFFTLSMIVFHGTTGFDTSAQLGTMGLFHDMPYTLTWGQAYAFGCLIWLGAMAVLIAICLVVSALAKNSFSALVIAFALYAIPLFIPWQLFPGPLPLIGSLTPINQMQMFDLTDFAKLDLGGFQLNVMWLALPIAIVATVISIFWSKRAFAKHQVL